MIQITVGVGDCRVCKGSDSRLITYALGSCIAVIVHDPQAGVGGMLHFMLPESRIDSERAGRQPSLFADTGIPLLLQKACDIGAEKKRLVVTVTGGSQMMDPENTFCVGKRNYMAMRKSLWKAGVLVHAEEVGGSVSRTVRLEVGSGKVFLRAGCDKEQEFASRKIGGQNSAGKG